MAIQSCIDETVNDMRKLPLSLTRSGRFDRKIEVEVLDAKDAVATIRHYEKHFACRYMPLDSRYMPLDSNILK